MPKVNSDTPSLSFSEAASSFLASLPSGEREVSQQEIHRFARWFGWEQSIAGLAAPQVANYAERLSLSDRDYANKLELVRAFLVYAKKQGWIKVSLANHLKARKGKARLQPLAKPGLPDKISLTQQGYAELEVELAELKDKRYQAIEEMRKAAADKDFSENAPLDAAREQSGQLEGRIKELEEVLKLAVLINEEQRTVLQVSIGDNVILCDLASGEELCYMIVSPREVNPFKGKISSVSPIGKALIGQSQGEVVEVAAPVGKFRYQIKQVKR